MKRILGFLIFSALAIAQVPQSLNNIDSINWNVLAPQPPPTISATTSAYGPATYYYWVVSYASYTSGIVYSKPTGPAIVYNGPNDFNSMVTAHVGWQKPSGTISGYYVLRTTSPNLPNGAANIQVAQISSPSITTLVDNISSSALTSFNFANGASLSVCNWTISNGTISIPCVSLGGSLALTTTGTTGAATLIGSTLNIPQYQGALTLTTSGTSGTATLVGNTLNVPNYSFSSSVTSVFGRTGIVTAQTGDYLASQVTNAADVTASNTFTPNQYFNGNVGIGTASPTHLLEVNGTALINGTLIPASVTLQPAITLTTTGSSGAATFIGNTLNIPNYSFTQTYPGTGIANSTGSAWGTSYSVSGTGNVVLTNSPSLVTPNLGTPTSINIMNATGLTASQIQSPLTGLTGCNVANQPYIPQSNTCIAITSGVSSITGDGSLITNSASGGAVTLTVGTAPANDFWNGAWTQPSFSNLSGTATTSQLPTGISAPPYAHVGGNYYLTQDGYYQATLPSMGSWSALGTDTGTVTTQTNGNQFVSTSGTYFLEATSGHTSIEAVFNSIESNSTSSCSNGIWMYDSTNGKIYTLILVNGPAAALYVANQLWTYSGSGQPAYSSATNHNMGSLPVHIKMSVSGTTLSYYNVVDGNTYTLLGTVTVGTMSGEGVYGNANCSGNYMSMVTN